MANATGTPPRYTTNGISLPNALALFTAFSYGIGSVPKHSVFSIALAPMY
jgi:hypothetical protein